MEDPPANSMASFKFTSVVLPEGTTFIFSSWVCVADGAGDSCRHTISITEPKTLAAIFHSELDEFVDNLDDLLTMALPGRSSSPFSMRLHPAAITMLESDSLQSEVLRSRS
jgi:hypothetical protein